MTDKDKMEVVGRINEIIKSYERMLDEIVIKKDGTFDSAPFSNAISALIKVLSE